MTAHESTSASSCRTNQCLGRRQVRGHHKDSEVDLEVRRDATHPGSHILMVIHGSPCHPQRRTVEYVTDDRRSTRL
jgi:hypothetical protein